MNVRSVDTRVVSLPENTDGGVLVGLLRDHFLDDLGNLAAVFKE